MNTYNGRLAMPDYYPCGHCKRDLKVSEYLSYGSFGNTEVQRSNVHVHYSPNYSPFTLMCTCGHYTVVTDVRSS